MAFAIYAHIVIKIDKIDIRIRLFCYNNLYTVPTFTCVYTQKIYVCGRLSAYMFLLSWPLFFTCHLFYTGLLFSLTSSCATGG